MNIKRAAARCVHRGAAAICGDGAGADPPPSDSNADLRREIEDQKQRLPVLERKLEIQRRGRQGRRRQRAADHRQRLALPDRLHRRREFRAPARHAARRRPRLRRRIGAGNRRHLHPAARAPDDRRHVRRHLRLPLHAGLRAAAARIIVDAYIAARFNPAAVVTVGKFKPPVGLERLQSSADIRFIERALPTAWFRTATSVCSSRANSPVAPSPTRSVTSTASPTARAATTSRRPTSKSTPPATTPRASSSSRSSTRTTSTCAVSASASARTWVDVDGTAANTALSAYRSPGQQSVFSYRANTATGVTPNNATFADGQRLRLAPQLYYYRGSFGFLGEYTQVEQDVVARRRRRHAFRHADATPRGRHSSRGSSPAKKKPSAASRRAAPSSRARTASGALGTRRAISRARHRRRHLRRRRATRSRIRSPPSARPPPTASA